MRDGIQVVCRSFREHGRVWPGPCLGTGRIAGDARGDDAAAALAAGEVPGFSAQGSIVEHKDTKWGVKDTRLLQTLKREGTGVNGRKPTFIRIWAFLLPGADMAYELATEYAGTTPIVRGKPRLHSHWLAEGSCSGLPIGEKS